MFSKNPDSIRESMNKMRVERMTKNDVVDQTVIQPDGTSIRTITHYNQTAEVYDFAVNGRGDYMEASAMLTQIAAPKPVTAVGMLRQADAIDVQPIRAVKVLR